MHNLLILSLFAALFIPIYAGNETYYEENSASAHYGTNEDAELLNIVPYPVSLKLAGEPIDITCRPYAVCAKGSSGVSCSHRLLSGMNAIIDDFFTYLPYCTKDDVTIKLEVHVDQDGGEYPVQGEAESYTLRNEGRVVSITAPHSRGALHATSTFVQLVNPTLNAEGNTVGATFQPVEIEDEPRYEWRSVMLDVARHWYPVNSLKKLVRSLVLAKVNIFHIHLTDAESWSTRFDRHPETERASYRYGPHVYSYTTADIREIVSYAALRGVRVIPEFDLPGHSHAAGSIDTEYAAQCKGPVKNINNVPFNVGSKRARAFAKEIVQELLELFPTGHIHLGGDELVTAGYNCLLNDPFVKTELDTRGLAHTKDSVLILIREFFDELKAVTDEHKAQRIFWNEAPLELGVPIDGDLIEVWSDVEALKPAQLQKGSAGVIFARPYYLDKTVPVPLSGATDSLPYLWLDNILRMYRFDVESHLTDQEGAAPLVGFEAPMWSEQLSPAAMISRNTLRIAAISERYWSTKERTELAGKRDVFVFADRYHQYGCHLLQAGVTFSPLRPSPPCPVNWQDADHIY